MSAVFVVILLCITITAVLAALSSTQSNVNQGTIQGAIQSRIQNTTQTTAGTNIDTQSTVEALTNKSDLSVDRLPVLPQVTETGLAAPAAPQIIEFTTIDKNRIGLKPKQSMGSTEPLTSVKFEKKLSKKNEGSALWQFDSSAVNEQVKLNGPIDVSGAVYPAPN